MLTSRNVARRSHARFCSELFLVHVPDNVCHNFLALMWCRCLFVGWWFGFTRGSYGSQFNVALPCLIPFKIFFPYHNISEMQQWELHSKWIHAPCLFRLLGTANPQLSKDLRQSQILERQTETAKPLDQERVRGRNQTSGNGEGRKGRWQYPSLFRRNL